MSETSEGLLEAQVAQRYLLKIDKVLSELTLDEVRRVALELEDRMLKPTNAASSAVDS